MQLIHVDLNRDSFNPKDVWVLFVQKDAEGMVGEAVSWVEAHEFDPDTLAVTGRKFTVEELRKIYAACSGRNERRDFHFWWRQINPNSSFYNDRRKDEEADAISRII